MITLNHQCSKNKRTLFIMDIRNIIRIDGLIKCEGTGTPKELSHKLDLSVRAIFKYLKYMKEDLNAPIEFSKSRKCYCYNNDGGFNLKWKNNRHN